MISAVDWFVCALILLAIVFTAVFLRILNSEHMKQLQESQRLLEERQDKWRMRQGEDYD